MWIAFVLWNSDICHSKHKQRRNTTQVVNCFCSLKFRYLSQLNLMDFKRFLSCELLLFFEIQIFVTVLYNRVPLFCTLWIAFVLWNSDICHSEPSLICVISSVVNCFCSLKFRYLSQHNVICYILVSSCELLLFFEIQIFVTAFIILRLLEQLLWIAFVLWNSDICHSLAMHQLQRI